MRMRFLVKVRLVAQYGYIGLRFASVIKDYRILRTYNKLSFEELNEKIGQKIHRTRMQFPNWRYFNDFSLNELQTISRIEKALFGHCVEVVNREMVSF